MLVWYLGCFVSAWLQCYRHDGHGDMWPQNPQKDQCNENHCESNGNVSEFQVDCKQKNERNATDPLHHAHCTDSHTALSTSHSLCCSSDCSILFQLQKVAVSVTQQNILFSGADIMMLAILIYPCLEPLVVIYFLNRQYLIRLWRAVKMVHKQPISVTPSSAYSEGI